MAKVGKILLAVVQIGAIIALNAYAPGIANALTGALGFSVSSFAVTAIGSTLIALGGAMISNALFRPKSDMSASKVNTRIEQASRMICGGRVLQGGQGFFGEFDTAGNLWIGILHCDSPLASAPIYYLDNVQVTVDGSGNVTHPDFMHKGKTYFRLWTHTYTESNPVPSGAAELQAAFGTGVWDVLKHQLVGTTYTIMQCKPIKIEDRYKVYRWRGPFGLGEPNVAVLGDWSYMYDPRDPTQTLGDRTTYKPSRNNALVWAWWRTHPYGRRKLESDINWDRIAEQADICDQTVTGIEGSQPRYECAIAARDDVDRGNIEQQIMMAGDGQIVFDNDGKSWVRVGYYYTPTLTFSRNRDIIMMESVEAQDGESETQGVVVRYIDPLAGYTLQSSAPWHNPNYYKPGEGNTFLVVDIPTISNHNQAMRVAKGMGMRSQPLQKIAPTVGLRGLNAMQERIVDILYDNEFAGDYEIAAPVEIDESGMFCSLGAVPINEHRWTLLTGEEKPRPNGTSSYVDIPLDLASGVSAVYNNGRIEVQFAAPTRADVRYEFEYIAEKDESTGQWSRMTTDMDAMFAYSGPVDTSIPQRVRWKTISNGGAETAPSSPVTIGAVVTPLPPPTEYDVDADNVVTYRNPSDSRFSFVRIYRASTTDFADATAVSDVPGGLSQLMAYDGGPGAYHWWLRSFNEGATLQSDLIGPLV